MQEMWWRMLGNGLPWAKRYPFPAKGGTVLTPDQARELFREYYDEAAEYVVDDQQHARKIIDRKTAIENGLNRLFLGTPCGNGHVSARRLRRSREGKSDEHTSKCISCVRAYKRRVQGRNKNS